MKEPLRVSDREPTEEQLFAWMDTLSNWERWGPDDQRGTLNHITPDVTRRATGLVQDGVTVSCAKPWTYERFLEPNPPRVPDYHMLSSGDTFRPGQGPDFQVAADYIGVAFHSRTITHVDSLSHLFWDASMYNGKPSKLVTVADGATSHGVGVAASGIVTRGILIDATWLRGLDALPPGTGIGLDDLEAAAARCGVLPETGDVVLLRAGVGSLGSGPLPELLPTLHEAGVAMLGSDTGNNVRPSPYQRLTIPVHQIGIVAMGLWILDAASLEGLALACRERQRWQFLLNVLPLPIPNATGSPVNPVAVF